MVKPECFYRFEEEWNVMGKYKTKGNELSVVNQRKLGEALFIPLGVSLSSQR